MDASTSAAIVSLGGGVITVGGVVFSSVRSSKDKTARKADLTVAERTAQKIAAESELIAEQTRGLLLNDIRADLQRKKDELVEAQQKLTAAKVELEIAQGKAEQLRELLAEKNAEIDAQNATIRRLTRRAETLEVWITTNNERFCELGIEPLPPDLIDDRRHTPPAK